MVRYSNVIWIPNSPTIWIPEANGCRLIFLCVGSVFKWLVYYIGHSTFTDHLNSQPFEIWTLKCLVLKCFRYSNGRYSDPPGTLYFCSVFMLEVIFTLSIFNWNFFQEPNRKFTLAKSEWDSVALERIEMATDPTKSADLAACVMQEGLAHVCLVSNSLTLVRAKIDVNLPRKRRGNTQQHEKALHRFYEVRQFRGF